MQSSAGALAGIEVQVALSRAFSLLHSELNDFLFAQIGEEGSGAPLSVLSALTRLGIDPWAEGARLSDLPRDAAARALVSMIVMFPKEGRSAPDVLKLAERLAALLPRRAPASTPRVAMSGGGQRLELPGRRFLWLCLLVLLLGMAAYGLLPGR